MSVTAWPRLSLRRGGACRCQSPKWAGQGVATHHGGGAWSCQSSGPGDVNHSLPNQVAALGRSLAAERGRSLIEGGALRALEIAVGGAQARVGGACRALDRAKERLRLQQVGGAWALRGRGL